MPDTPPNFSMPNLFWIPICQTLLPPKFLFVLVNNIWHNRFQVTRDSDIIRQLYTISTATNEHMNTMQKTLTWLHFATCMCSITTPYSLYGSEETISQGLI